MSAGPKKGYVALLLMLSLSAGRCASSADDKPPKRYPTPRAVFDANREAQSKRDWRTCFSLLTREVQDHAVFEVYFACGMHPEESNAVLKRFGVDDATLTSELRREYKAKHGVEPADDDALDAHLKREYKAAHGADAPEPRDIWTDFLLRRIKDKAGFYEAALNLLLANHPASRIGDLEQVVIQDDKATGRVAIPIFAYDSPPGEAPRKVEDKYYKPFRFRKINGGWLLDTL